MGIDENGVGGGDEHITSERDLESSGDRVAADGADYRFPAYLHLVNGIGVKILNVAFEDGFRCFQVDAGAEGSSGAGEDDCADGGVGIERLDRPREIDDHWSRERVKGFRAVDHDVCHS